MIAYTDGITATENDHGEPWGQQRLKNLLRSYSRMTPERIIKGILDQVSKFANGQPQHDDMTLLVMGVHGGLRRQVTQLHADKSPHDYYISLAASALRQMPKNDRNPNAPFCRSAWLESVLSPREAKQNGQSGASLGGFWPMGSSIGDIAPV